MSMSSTVSTTIMPTTLNRSLCVFSMAHVPSNESYVISTFLVQVSYFEVKILLSAAPALWLVNGDDVR